MACAILRLWKRCDTKVNILSVIPNLCVEVRYICPDGYFACNERVGLFAAEVRFEGIDIALTKVLGVIQNVLHRFCFGRSIYDGLPVLIEEIASLIKIKLKQIPVRVELR
ncbi:hypothetical protein D3C72_1011400 [compost metagenome]